MPEREKRKTNQLREKSECQKKKVENVSKDKKRASTKTSENAKKDPGSYLHVHFDQMVDDPAKK